MSGIPVKHRETFARLKRATAQLHELIESGEFYAFGYLKRRALLKRVRRLYNRLAGPVSPVVIKGALAAAGVLALAGCWGREETPPQTPDFVRVDATTIGLGGNDNTGRPEGYLVLADTDGDGDLDLYYSENYAGTAITRQQNNGTGAFGAKERNPDGLLGLQTSGTLRFEAKPLAFVDIDGDTDLDLLATGMYSNSSPYVPRTDGTTMLFVNTGTAAAPAFAAPVLFAPGNTIPDYPEAAEFVDIDGDGDLDLVTSHITDDAYFGSTVYLTPNTSQSPSSFTPGPTVDFPYTDYFLLNKGVAGLAITDLDKDSDADITISYYTEVSGPFDHSSMHVQHIDNQSSDEEGIVFAASAEDPYGLSFPFVDNGGERRWNISNETDQLTSLAAGDIDNDGDIDLIIGVYRYDTYLAPNYDTEFFYFENQAAE